MIISDQTVVHQMPQSLLFKHSACLVNIMIRHKTRRVTNQELFIQKQKQRKMSLGIHRCRHFRRKPRLEGASERLDGDDLSSKWSLTSLEDSET
ncbi:hypothetical protein CEXT_170541 [Caerostris extrusa]|uniref:Uncharacterized protein n=1 Tax=Caerostris extrusa TaxID=172846 RepID=A0AAV4M890_CAEEX|nr:hypothetical protein CEXT_170541 [Caerostris extrusa]